LTESEHHLVIGAGTYGARIDRFERWATGRLIDAPRTACAAPATTSGTADDRTPADMFASLAQRRQIQRWFEADGLDAIEARNGQTNESGGDERHLPPTRFRLPFHRTLSNVHHR